MDAFELYRRWWADVPTRLGTASVKRYRREVFAACADLGKHPLDVTVRDIDRHLGELRPQHASLRRAALADFFGFLEDAVRAFLAAHEPNYIDMNDPGVFGAYSQALGRVVNTCAALIGPAPTPTTRSTGP